MRNILASARRLGKAFVPAPHDLYPTPSAGPRVPGALRTMIAACETPTPARDSLRPGPACEARTARVFRGCRVILTSHSWMLWSGIALAAAAMCYTLAAALAVRIRLKAAAYELPDQAPAVTILKPLCGEEHELYECLRSFCDADVSALSDRVRRLGRRRSGHRCRQSAAARVSARSTCRLRSIAGSTAAAARSAISST